MMTTRTKSFLTGLFLASILGTGTVQASVIVVLLLNPFSTAGGGATSTRSGYGAWQLYAIEDSNSFGISSYNIAMSGTTAINHRAPVTTINDSNGDPQTAGFNLLRTGTNVNPIQASQGLPGSTPFPITGFGQTASDFTTKATAIDAGAAVVGPTTSGTWGNYNSPALSQGGLLANGATAAAAAVAAGRKWVFLAEGLGTAGVTSITSAVFTVFTNTSGASAATTTEIISGAYCLGCVPPTVSSTVINNVNANDPGAVAYKFSVEWFNTVEPVTETFSFVSGPTPAIPPTFSLTTNNFNWNTIGSPIGSYKWSLQASQPSFGSNTGFITVNITVPEPTMLSLVGLGLIGCLSFTRRRACLQQGIV